MVKQGTHILQFGSERSHKVVCCASEKGGPGPADALARGQALPQQRIQLVAYHFHAPYRLQAPPGVRSS